VKSVPFTSPPVMMDTFWAVVSFETNDLAF
jgi:hypothetical protein